MSKLQGIEKRLKEIEKVTYELACLAPWSAISSEKRSVLWLSYWSTARSAADSAARSASWSVTYSATEKKNQVEMIKEVLNE